MKINEGSIWVYYFWLGVARCPSYPIRFWDSFIISILAFFAWRLLSMKGSIRGYHFCLGVESFLSYPVRLQGSFIINISEKINWCLIFLHGYCLQGKVVSKTFTFGLIGLLCFFPSQIAGFFDQQYLWKKLINVLVFCISLVLKER